MKKLGRNSLAVGLTTLLVTSAVAFSAQAEDAPVAQSNSSAATGTGLFSSLQLDSGTCTAIFPNGAPTGACGPELNTTAIDTFAQEAQATAQGTSAANASVSPINVATLESALDLSDLVDDIGAVDSRTILGSVLGPLGTLVQEALNALGLDVAVNAIDDVVGEVLGSVDGAIPVTLDIGAVNAQCTAGPGTATGSSSVADIFLNLQLTEGPEGRIRIPLTTATSENRNLLVDAPEELLDGVFDGLRDTLTESLGGALSGANPLLTAVEDALVDPLLQAIEGPLLSALAEAIEGLVTGEVNSQDVSPSGDSIEVSALELTLLGAENELDLARVECGPNAGPIDTVDDAVDDGPGLDGPGNDDVVDGPGDNVSGRDGGPGGAIADADAQADADVSVALPNAGAPNLLPFWLLGLGLVLFGAAVMINERRRALL